MSNRAVLEWVAAVDALAAAEQDVIRWKLASIEPPPPALLDLVQSRRDRAAFLFEVFSQLSVEG